MKHLLKKHRMLSVGIFLAAVLSIIYAAILSPAGKSTGSFSEFCTTLFREEMKSNTMNLHFTLKDPKAAGIDSYEITLGSLSGDSPHNQARQLKKLSEELKKYSHRSLKGKDRLTCRLLSDYISRQQNLAAYPYYDEPLTPSGGVTSQLPVLLAEYTFRNTRDIKDYLGLLSQMDTYFLGILDYEQKKADAGLFMSDEACLKVIEGCEVFTEHPDDNFLIDTFSNRLNAMDGLTDTQKNAYLKQHSKVLSDHVIPAYSQMIKGLTMLLGRGHNNWGLCNFPKGKAYYGAVVSADTGCDDSVEDLFSQIAKARREDLTFCQNLLEKNPKLASQSPKPDAALKEENAMLSRLQKEILTDFPAPPQTEVEICHVDPALSEYLAPAFYITAPIDDISHNRIYINDAKMIRISITLQRLRMKDIPVICTRPSAPPPMVLRKSSPSSTIRVTPKAGQPTRKCSLSIMPDLIRISPPCYSTTRLQHSASMPLRISEFIILDGKKKKTPHSGANTA